MVDEKYGFFILLYFLWGLIFPVLSNLHLFLLARLTTQFKNEMIPWKNEMRTERVLLKKFVPESIMSQCGRSCWNKFSCKKVSVAIFFLTRKVLSFRYMIFARFEDFRRSRQKLETCDKLEKTHEQTSRSLHFVRYCRYLTNFPRKFLQQDHGKLLPRSWKAQQKLQKICFIMAIISAFSIISKFHWKGSTFDIVKKKWEKRFWYYPFWKKFHFSSFLESKNGRQKQDLLFKIWNQQLELDLRRMISRYE